MVKTTYNISSVELLTDIVNPLLKEAFELSKSLDSQGVS